ncbi:hypothetical protein [Streptomyces tropicalis]|uniref:Integral membrane protein n=1 Tax=Streptomyces tropicalis TaxID=3034234 RepID=A0ABT6AAL0_9ACTN|nr:hypothetical protein [Streptomyces tropicalis]MDF3300845.1 hypothetical protein [Streptomyces tropicalis]
MTAPQPRPLRTGGDLRILRAAVFAAVCVVLAAAGHTMASCATVPLWTLGAGFLGALLVVAPLAGRERSLPGIAALLAVGQTVLHTLFGLGQSGAMASGTMPAGASRPMAAMGALPAMSDAALVQRAAHLVCGTTAAAISPAQAHRILVDARIYDRPGLGTGAMHHPADAVSAGGSAASLLPSLPMLLGHLLAAVVAGWLLRRGDLALLRLIRLSAHGVAETALVLSLRGALALVRALCAGLPAVPGPRPLPWAAGHETPVALIAAALQHTVVRRGPPAACAPLLAA